MLEPINVSNLVRKAVPKRPNFNRAEKYFTKGALKIDGNAAENAGRKYLFNDVISILEDKQVMAIYDTGRNQIVVSKPTQVVLDALKKAKIFFSIKK